VLGFVAMEELVMILGGWIDNLVSEINPLLFEEAVS